ncbi:MAG: NAD(P)-binding protein [Anaerolineae bacterium]|nr:NAD(P)-binding protein [Anaerolineae bacterium]
MPDPRTAIIVGGGIAGLTTATPLRRLGMRVAVYERTPEIREVGAGLTLWGNAMQALQRLGLARAVQGAGMAGLGGSIRDLDGRPLATVRAILIWRPRWGRRMWAFTVRTCSVSW